MTLPVKIEGHDHPGETITAARVTQAGQLITAAISYDETKFIELAEDDTAYNFYKPQASKQFVVTGIRAKADRNVSNTVDAAVIFYEASSATTTTVDKILHQEALVRGESVTLLPTNILVKEGKFVNGKTSDDNIFVTIMGYFIPVIEE